jgi:phosphoglycerate kinase
LVKRAGHNEPAIKEEQLVSALEKFPMAELQEGRGVVFCDVLDAHAFLQWIANSMPDSDHRDESFQHRRQEVLNRTLVHEGVEWMARRLELFQMLDSAFKEFLTKSRVEKKSFAEQFNTEYGMDINCPEGLYHLFAEACDDFRRPPLQKHLPNGVLASAADFLFKALGASGALVDLYQHVEEQSPELGKETYVFDEIGHSVFEDLRKMLETRGLRIAPLQEVREVDRLIEDLNRCQKDSEGKMAAIEELTKRVPGMMDFFDIFRIQNSPQVELDPGCLAAIRSRLLAHLSPGSTPRRVAIVGYNQNIIAALRRISSAYADHIELVAIVGQKPRDIMQWIKYNSQLGIFEGVRGNERGYLYLGKQKSAVAIYHGRLTEPAAVMRSLPWKALGVKSILISEDQARKVPAEMFDSQKGDGIEIVIARTQMTEDQPFLPSISARDGSLDEKGLGLLSSEEVAYSLGVSALSELGKIFVLGADIVEKHDDPAVVQPTYRVAGVYQVIHKKNPDRFCGIAKKLGLTDTGTQMLATNEFKTNIPRGKLLRLHAVLDSRISKERVVALFRKKAAELDFLDLPEWWVQLTSNINFGNPHIMFDPNQVYVSQNDAGTQVSIAFFLDEAVADVEGALRLIAGRSGRRELETAPDPFATGIPGPSRNWAELDVAQKTEFSSRHVPTLARKYWQKGEANTTKRQARKYATSREGTGGIPVVDPKLINDAVRLLFLESQPIIHQEVLKDASGEAVAMVALHENRHKLYATSLLTAVSLENVHHVMGRYYEELRKYALRLSREYDWEILIHDVYEYGDKLRATLRVHHLDYNEKTSLFDRVTFLSVDQYNPEHQRWQMIARPNSILYPSPPGTYNIAINGPGGRMGSCTYRIASKSDKLRVVALGGPDARRLAELLNEKDYVQGRYPGTVEYGNDWIALDGKRSLVFSHGVFRDPGNYPWKCFILMGIPIHAVIDATGRFNNLDGVNRHRRAGALRVMITAPGSSKEDEWSDATFIRHINDHRYDPTKHFFLSPASCTTGCLANLNRLIEMAIYQSKKRSEFNWDEFYREAGQMVIEGIGPTYHALTGEHIGPDIIDPAEYKKDLRRGTDATGNIFETTSGASANTALVDAAGTSYTPVYAIRIPIETVSIMAPTYVLRGHYTVEHIEAAARIFEKACRVGDETRFQFLRNKMIDRSTQIRLLRELAEAGVTISQENIEVAHFTSPGGEAMTAIQLTGWYENEWRPSKMYIEFLEEVMLPSEMKYQDNFSRFPYVPDVPPKFERPYAKKASLLDLPDEAFDGRYWIVRVDHNVITPLYDPALNRLVPSISDDHRISASAGDIAYLVRKNARVIVLSHNSRKKDFQSMQTEDGQVVELFSLRIAGERLAEILESQKVLKGDRDFFLAPGVVDAETTRLSQALQPGQVLYLENLRFHEGEEAGNRHFAKAIFDTLFGHLDPSAQNQVNYANIAFGASHRGFHASFLPLMNLIRGHKVLGLLQMEELEALDTFMKEPKKPVVAFVSGVKIEEKIPAIEAMIRHGAIQTLFTASPAFLVASGFGAGNSLPGDDPMELEREVAAAHRLLELAAEFGTKVMIPMDVHVGFEKPDKTRPHLKVRSRIAGVEEIPFGSYVFDIAANHSSGHTRTAEEIKAILAEAGTVLYNGTVGLYEVEQFAAGTNWIIDAIAESKAQIKLVVGGDGVTAVSRQMGGTEEAKKKFTLCTGGGAALKYLATQTLSALEGLDGRQGSK